METPGTSFGTQPPANGMSTQMKIGLGFGVVVFLALIGFLVYFFVFRKRSSEKEEAEPEEEETDVEEVQDDTDDEEDPTCPTGASLVDGVCKAATAIGDPRQTRSITEQKVKADEKLNTSLVKGYTDKGNFRLLAGNSGWDYQQRIGGSVNECADICNKDSKCKGFSTTKYSSGQMECMMYNKGQTTGAKYYNECKVDPGSVNECRTSVTGNLFWKN